MCFFLTRGGSKHLLCADDKDETKAKRRLCDTNELFWNLVLHT